MTDAERRALLAALDAEYAAVYAYGVVAAFASGERTRLVAENTAGHRARRDATLEALGAAGDDAPAPRAAYTSPIPVEGPIDAAKLAVAVENETAAAWLAVAERADGEAVRRAAVEALTESALRAATWQAILGVAPATTAFPGRA